MAAEIFCDRLNGNIRAMRKRLEIKSGPIGVVGHDDGTARMRSCGDGGKVLNFKRVGARRLDIDDFCVGLHQCSDA